MSLLNDLSANYACVRKLVNFEEIQFILNNHTVRVHKSEIEGLL